MAELSCIVSSGQDLLLPPPFLVDSDSSEFCGSVFCFLQSPETSRSPDRFFLSRS
jgi:hypothetical protein